MRTLRALTILSAVTALASTTPVLAQQIQVSQVVAGLASPVFVGNAGDSLDRLFIVERAGTIKVLQADRTTLTTFLNISSKVVSAGSEQGLLGLAFHPQYQANGRFFVFYTRTGDGAIVVAEYHASAGSNTADATETPLLTVPHSTNANHNGGMLAFGPDGYLYIGVGDGGGGNDVPNNAQNKDLLLGKILRIDVGLAAGAGYTSPPDNPFFGTVDGRDEIFAYGMRNPWRFSFDALSGAQWVGDVGQENREEVDTPIVNGGNYGWRVFEGTACTRIDRSLCSKRGDYILPIFDYTHSGGRCSITGGYVYRGLRATVAPGTYVFGDYCSGEIFAWNGSTQSVLLDTALNISSFGEDEDGELYVVGLGGTISRIERGCASAIVPTSETYGPAGGTGTVAVTTGADCEWTAMSNVSWITVTPVATGSVNYSVAPYSGPSKTRTGTVTIAGQTFTIKQSK